MFASTREALPSMILLEKALTRRFHFQQFWSATLVRIKGQKTSPDLCELSLACSFLTFHAVTPKHVWAHYNRRYNPIDKENFVVRGNLPDLLAWTFSQDHLWSFLSFASGGFTT
jgi:hypothetical protein